MANRHLFSQLSTDLTGTLNSLAKARQRREREGGLIMDLTQSTVGECGLSFPPEPLKKIAAQAFVAASHYQPHCLGSLPARQAIAEFYSRRGFSINPENILMTPGSSQAYLYLFKLLANPGEEFLAPEPSYPLFDYLAKIAGVQIRPYLLKEKRDYPHWQIDLEELENRITTKTRGILLVSPHNPTGCTLDSETIDRVCHISRLHRLPLIHDEVFSEFTYDGIKAERFLDQDVPLTFTLNGLSKTFLLPGFKLGWIIVSGEEKRVKESLERLEILNDIFLPVNEIAQSSLPALIGSGEIFLSSLRDYLLTRLEEVKKTLKDCKRTTLLVPQAGFTVILKLKDLSGERLSHELLEKGVFVHPGVFYDLADENLVFSFLHPSEKLRQGLSVLASRLD